MPRDNYPVTPPRAFVRYRLPERIPMQSADPRAAYDDARRFIERCARLVVRETMFGVFVDPNVTGGPTDPPEPAVQRVVQRLTGRFGEPTLRPKPERLRVDWSWGLPIERAAEVVDFLGGLVMERPDEARYVIVALSWMFFLRDLTSGKTLPFQQRKYRSTWPLISYLSLTLGQESGADLVLIFPFEQPDERCRQYVLALQEHTPVPLDPRYFDHFAPRGTKGDFERTRLPPGWLAGEDVDLTARPGEIRSTAAVARVDSHANSVATVADALRTHAYRAIVVTGPGMVRLPYVAERAAKAAELPLSIVDAMLEDVDQAEHAVTQALANVGTGPAVLVIESLNLAWTPVRSALEDLVRTRRMGRTSLPDSLRVVVTNTLTSRTTDASTLLHYRASREGFLPDSVLREWERELYARMAGEIRITFDPWKTKGRGMSGVRD